VATSRVPTVNNPHINKEMPANIAINNHEQSQEETLVLHQQQQKYTQGFANETSSAFSPSNYYNIPCDGESTICTRIVSSCVLGIR